MSPSDNDRRRQRAKTALRAVPDCYAPDEEGITDAITDLLHLAGAQHLEIEELLCRARRNYRSEQLDAEDSLTYHVRLVLDNDEALYRHRREIVKEHLVAPDDCPICGGSGEGPIASEQNCDRCNGTGFLKRYPCRLGDRLKDFCEELAGLDINENDLLSNLARELLSTALAWVDWTELAEACIEEAQAEGEVI